MTANGIADLAADAGLLYMTDEAPGHRRIRRGKGFSYTTVDGRVVPDEERRRIEAMAIPPAWDGVWISPEPMGHILATGYDDAGRKQYIYHPLWEDIRDEVKFGRTADFGARLAGLRKRIDADLSKRGMPREKVVALAAAVLDRTMIRIGNRRYLEANESYGLTTLTSQHADVVGTHVVLEFEGKSGAEHQIAFRDRRLATLIARCQELNGQTLFSYEADGQVGSVTSTEVNDYLSAGSTLRFTAKDMRTWGGTCVVAEELVAGTNGPPSEKRVLEAIDAAAERLGNTRAVCRASYVHPAILEAYEDGSLGGAWTRSRSGRWLSRPESTVNRLLAG